MNQEEFQKHILDLLRDLKTDMRDGFAHVDKRFEQVDKRFTEVDRRFEQVDRQIQQLREDVKDVKYDVRADKDKLQQVYEVRDKVKITFWLAVELGKLVYCHHRCRNKQNAYLKYK